ncbi:hypothetical protein Pint_06164 [Pistacia integerrima]|uniref:Uncharacterized protein n=1 Tax=Pistacia integerrima TaxID=434235 RepID=A0ACC0Z341_9ROSI|nr:hypothetical protein Pint_06164 [Pistacia integerrima]
MIGCTVTEAEVVHQAFEFFSFTFIYCYEDDCTKEDPLSQESFRKLASPLPYSKQHHSKLVCYITKELMDTENPPQVLPNGYVYSTKALEEMAKKNNGKITCPRTVETSSDAIVVSFSTICGYFFLDKFQKFLIQELPSVNVGN